MDDFDIDSLFETNNDVDYGVSREEADQMLEDEIGGWGDSDTDDSVYYFDPVTGEGKWGTQDEANAAEQAWTDAYNQSKEEAQSNAEELDKTLDSKGNTPEQDRANRLLDYADSHNMNSTQTQTVMNAITNDKNLMDALIKAGDDSNVAGRPPIELVAQAILGGDDNAATQFMCLYGVDPTGVKSRVEAGEIQQKFQQLGGNGSAMAKVVQENSELYNYRNQLLKDVGIQTLSMFGPTVFGAIANTGFAALANSSKTVNDIARNHELVSKLIDGINKTMATSGAKNAGVKTGEVLSSIANGQGMNSLTRAGAAKRAIEALASNTDKLINVIELIGQGVGGAEAIQSVIAAGDNKATKSDAQSLGMMSEAERDKMIADLLNQSSAKKTGGGTYSEYAHAQPGDVINGHVVNQGDINYAINMLNTGGTGKTGQGFDANVLNGIQQDPFNLSITMPVGTGTIKSDQFNGYDPLNPTNTSNGVTLTMNPNYGFEPGQEKKAYYDDEYEAKAALQNALAQYGRGDNSLNNAQNINTTTANDNKPTDTNPGTGRQINTSVDDDSNNGGSDTDAGWNEETNKPNNPNQPGSDTTDGNGGNTNPNNPESDTIKDKNGETIDWDINKNRIGLSDDPNRANYDQADASKWNRGMEFQSTNLVSDKAVKSFINKTYKDDPIFKNAVKIMKEKVTWD